MENVSSHSHRGLAGSSAALPAPDAAAAAHSERLREHIRMEIQRAGGCIGFDRYMRLALYAPGLGYYSAGSRKLGAEGDFVTAPELGPLFARCLARHCAQVLASCRGDTLLELGAGSGALAADLLAELRALDALPERYLILEPSADLRARQRRRLDRQLPELAGRVQWLDRLPRTPLRGMILANEVLDALPVRRFVVTGDGLAEQAVAWGDDGPRWREVPADESLCRAVDAVQRDLPQPLPPGYRSEINTGLSAWVGALADSLERGEIWFADYGYPRREFYHPQRSEGTLLCHYRHRVHDDPFVLPGLQDITASVDFTAVAEAALAAGLDVGGYVSQANFLLASGLDRLLAASDPSDLAAHVETVRQARILTMPGEMGERFQVMALSRGLETPLPGFLDGDWRDRL